MWSWEPLFLSQLDSKMSPRVSCPHFDQLSSPIWGEMLELWGVCVCAKGGTVSRTPVDVFIHMWRCVFYPGVYWRESTARHLVAFLLQSYPHTPNQQRRSVSHLLLLTFPLFTAHCRDTPFDSAAHTWPSASFCSAVLLLKIASACPGSTASLHKLWGGWGWRQGWGVRRGVKREESEEGVP